MSENLKDSSTESLLEIRIERLNTDKTRKDIDSDTVYHVYFEISGYPPPEWRSIFGQQWKGLNLSQEASIDGISIVVHCQLHEIAATILPALKKVVAATNEAYKHYAQTEATALEHREDAWKEERKEVDAIAAQLRFE
ncbi:MAG: hypothetical protein WB699_02280 [Bacteroidota bacterium]